MKAEERKRFDGFIDVILRNEGGYVNDRDDKGGETKYGISKRFYPDVDIKNLTLEQAKEIYFRDYYSILNLKYIKDDRLALHVFDMAVNAGPHMAVILLQRLFKNCRNDGVLGPNTGQCAAQGSMSVDLVRAYKAARVVYYYELSKKGNQSKFLNGWVNRVNRT